MSKQICLRVSVCLLALRCEGAHQAAMPTRCGGSGEVTDRDSICQAPPSFVPGPSCLRAPLARIWEATAVKGSRAPREAGEQMPRHSRAGTQGSGRAQPALELCHLPHIQSHFTQARPQTPAPASSTLQEAEGFSRAQLCPQPTPSRELPGSAQGCCANPTPPTAGNRSQEHGKASAASTWATSAPAGSQG